MKKLTHFDSDGKAIMVDVSDKKISNREAVASGQIIVNKIVYEAILNGTVEKGDVLGVARIAGIMAAKKTFEMIPLCHPLPLTNCKIDFNLLPEKNIVEAIATVKTTALTGVEMEALHAVSVALLTIYDMCKALDKSMEIQNIHLDMKIGGKSGRYDRAKG
ncbi:MAG: cyclic pyranopterin monophosphate synthase MoaC [Selenomonadaceae bacterium]|nr:cyclic pyranopterin monophosphate synthase MoaC [Selenomonadaceae bacterium]